MNKQSAILAVCFAGLIGTLTAQAPAEKPLTEQEFLKKIDNINTVPNRPRLGLEGTGLDEKKRPPAPKKEKGETTITAEEALTFDNKSNEAVFIGKVVVKDPEFNVQCDRLDVFLKKEKDKGPDGKPLPAAKATPPAKPVPAANPPATGSASSPDAKGADADKKDSGGKLDHAIADANPGKIVVITQDKLEADGSTTKSIGNARRATYNATNGDIVLTGNPSVQQGVNLCVATDDNTVMTLNRDGRMKVDGPHKMVIKDSSNIEGK